MTWQQEAQKSITSFEDLKEFIYFSDEEKPVLENVISKSPMRVSRYYLSLIDKNNPFDPIRKMIIPAVNEASPDGFLDPSCEEKNTKLNGLQHKYSPTVLVLSTNECMAYCRHCFRKRLVGVTTTEILEQFNQVAKYIKNNLQVNNVLISGGDPLSLETSVLKDFFDKLDKIQHLKFIRLGSRVPVTFPDRILRDKELLKVFKQYSKPECRILMMTHFNHSQELTKQSIRVINLLLKSGVVVNNQTVLLRDVNDNPDTLVNLFNNLVAVGVNPYYLFQCRPAQHVTGHFAVPLLKGYQIIEQAKNRLSGPAKRFRYVMSHTLGKIEVLGQVDGEMYFKFHEAKDEENMGKLFKKQLSDTQTWLDDL